MLKFLRALIFVAIIGIIGWGVVGEFSQGKISGGDVIFVFTWIFGGLLCGEEILRGFWVKTRLIFPRKIKLLFFIVHLCSAVAFAILALSHKEQILRSHHPWFIILPLSILLLNLVSQFNFYSILSLKRGLLFFTNLGIGASVLFLSARSMFRQPLTLETLSIVGVMILVFFNAFVLYADSGWGWSKKIRIFFSTINWQYVFLFSCGIFSFTLAVMLIYLDYAPTHVTQILSVWHIRSEELLKMFVIVFSWLLGLMMAWSLANRRLKFCIFIFTILSNLFFGFIMGNAIISTLTTKPAMPPPIIDHFL